MPFKYYLLTSFLMVLLNVPVSQAQSISTSEPIPETNKTNTLSSTPIKGMIMQQVEDKYGSPLKDLPTVGNPPIQRWIYERFTVYFEGQYVIHSVINK